MSRNKAVTVDAFGRVLIPKDLREAAGLRAGTEVEIRHEAEGLRLVPREDGVLLREVDGILVACGEAVGDLASAVGRVRAARLGRLKGGRRRRAARSR